jgi:hypothetical protein
MPFGFGSMLVLTWVDIRRQFGIKMTMGRFNNDTNSEKLLRLLRLHKLWQGGVLVFFWCIS